ncbi:MAG: glycosyltransferase [Methanobrevibacter sp.]|jgi:glycosyltransferase involved in cell wall biosynthesis|nr:glycosyltransferase [Candidatus Methanoflexus mossambicus]
MAIEIKKMQEKQKKQKKPNNINNSVSVVIPAFNEEKNISKVISVLMEINYIDEIIVVDDGSHDKTSQIARESGAILIQHHYNQGKGAALQTGFKNSKGDIIAFLDGDISNINCEMVDKIIQPILTGKSGIVKTKFSRESGRVTQLTAKPLLRFFFPEINLEQPLSGQFAGKRSVLEKIKFERDYGVDIGIVLDADAKGIKIEEVDIGEIKHDISPLNSLNEMANEVVRTIISRATEYGRVTMMDTLGNYIRMATLGLSLIILGLFLIFFVTGTPLIIGEIVSAIGIVLTIFYLVKLIINSFVIFKKRPKANFLKSFFKMHSTLIISALVLVLMITTFLSAANFSNGKLSIEPSSRNLVIFPGSSTETIYLRGPYTVDVALENESNIIRMPLDGLNTLELSYGDIITIGDNQYTINQTKEGETNILRLPYTVRKDLNLRIGDQIQDSKILSFFRGLEVKQFVNSTNLSTNDTALYSFILNSYSVKGSTIDVYLDNKYITTLTGSFKENTTYGIYYDGYLVDSMYYTKNLSKNSYFAYFGNHIIEIKFKESVSTTKTFDDNTQGVFLGFNLN